MMTMQQRSFSDNIQVSVFGVGCGRIGSISNPVPMREIEATLLEAIDAGVNLFDTADIYGQGDSERTLSRLLARHRESMFVVTKVGGRHSRYAGAVRITKPLLRIFIRSRPGLCRAVVTARTAMVRKNFDPLDLCRAIDGSRRRLGLDQLDGLLLHGPPVGTLRSPKTHDFLADLLHRGKVRHLGVAVESLTEVEAGLSISEISILQVPVVLVDGLAQSPMAEEIRRRKIAVFVREVLSGVHLGMFSLREAISTAIAPDFVTSALIGVSTRHHLTELLSAFP
jgi:aryl-alcohol dehydrogenase-like predicted oxidoreductase